MKRLSNSKRGFRLKAIGIASLVIAADEGAKAFIRQHLLNCSERATGPCDHHLTVIGNLKLVHTENAGSAFGFFQGWGIWIVVAALGFLLIFVYSQHFRQTGWLAALAVGLQAGGALGNLFDRLVLGHVTDWIYVGSPIVFNLADVALVLGMIFALRALLSHGRTTGLQDRPTKVPPDLEGSSSIQQSV
jgi:signal peptidase II